MFSSMDQDGQEYYLKPMNCPFHIMYYKTGLRSYRDLPMRIGELGTVYRYANNDTLLATMAAAPTFTVHPPAELFDALGMTHTWAETDWRGNYILSSQVCIKSLWAL